MRKRVPAIRLTVTGWSPRGFGRSGERVANTPVKGIRRVATRLNLQHVTPGLVQPRHDNDRVADRNAVQSIAERRMHFEPRVRRALTALPRRILPRLQS